MPLPSSALSFGNQLVNALVDPTDVLGYLSVDTVFALLCTALAPAHNSGDKVSVAVARHMWPSAVPLTGVFCYRIVAGAEHAGRDAQGSGFYAGSPVHIRNSKALQDGRCLPVSTKATEAADHAVGLLHQNLLENTPAVSYAV